MPSKSFINETAITISAFSSPATLSTFCCASRIMLVCCATCVAVGVTLPPGTPPPPVVPPPPPPPVTSVYMTPSVPDGDMVPVEIAPTGAFDEDAKSNGITSPDLNSFPTEATDELGYIIDPSGSCKTYRK